MLILVAIYAIFGVISSSIYCLLAGWSFDAFVVMSFITPMLCLIAIVLFHLSVPETVYMETDDNPDMPVIIIGRDCDVYSVLRIMFWAWIFYCSLPIFSNIMGRTLWLFGQQELGLTIYDHRYYTLFDAFIIIVLSFLLFGVFPGSKDDR